MIEELIEKHIQYIIRLYRKKHMDMMGKIDNGYYTANKNAFSNILNYYRYRKFFKILRRIVRKIIRIAKIDPILAEKYKYEENTKLIVMKRIYETGGNTDVDNA